MKLKRLFAHGVLLLFVLIMFTPLYLALVAASHDAYAMMHAPIPFWPGTALFANIKTVMTEGLVAVGGPPIWQMLFNSLIMAVLIATGKILVALLSAFALIFLNYL